MASAVPELPVLARDQAFEILYRRYVKDVYHYALALLRNPTDAEDVTQTTFLNAYRAYQRGIEIEKPQNWLIKITGVLRALGRLPLNQRAALVMRELEGRSYAEIADTIGVSVSAVETLIFRARKSLRIKASSLRSLAAVPLPTSLTQFFEGGGVIAGGGAAVGTGFLVKAAVAIVAAALGTGVGGDQSGPAAAAADPSTVEQSSTGDASGLTAQWSAKLRVGGGHGAAGKGSSSSAATGAAGGGTQQASAGQSASPSSSTQTSSTQSSPVSQVTTTVSGLTSTVQQVVEGPTAAVPVQIPSLPTPPVEVPTVPVLPPLPPVP